MKKLIPLALMFFAAPSFAQNAFEGFYGQIGIGYESTSPGFSSGTTSGFAYSVPYESKSRGFAGVISVGGYMQMNQSFLLGLGVDYSPLSTSNANWSMTIPGAGQLNENKFEKKSSYNIFVSPALAIDKDKLAYAKIGFAGLSAQTTDPENLKDTYNFTGYSLGLGYKQAINGGLYGFAEGNYFSYGSKTLIEATGNIKPSTFNLLVGIGYKF
jgi:outer membrane immunogenic protein